MTESEIEVAADEVRQAHGMVTAPIDPAKMAEIEGIILLPGDYDDCFDGRIEYRVDAGVARFFLFYHEQSQVRGRARFSIAHELGHFYLPKHRNFLLSGKWHSSHADFVSDKQSEREADRFAACLLMPRQIFSRYVKRRSGFCTINDLLKLTDQFGTSLTSTAIRYVELCFEPCCIVVSQQGHVLYARRSDDMKMRGFHVVPSAPRGASLPQSCCSCGERVVDNEKWKFCKLYHSSCGS